MSDRDQPKAAQRTGASLMTQVDAADGAGSSPRRLAGCDVTMQLRSSEAGHLENPDLSSRRLAGCDATRQHRPLEAGHLEKPRFGQCRISRAWSLWRFLMGDHDGLIQDGATATDRAGPSRTKGRTTRGSIEAISKVVGAATAVLALGAALYGLGHFVYGIWQDSDALADLIVIARDQQDREQFREAWATLATASKIEQTSSFVIGTKALHQAEEDLGMAWLDNIRIGEGETFTSIAAMVEPVLYRGQSSAGPQRQADLLAHLGWAAFLRSREQGTNPDVIERAYRKAIVADPTNPYANAMLGHWIVWHARDLDAARPYFATAVASGRAPGFVRGLQLAALGNASSAEVELEQIRVANEMRKSGQAVPGANQSRLWDVYHSFFRADTGEYGIGHILSVVPPEEHLLTFHWLFDRAGFDGGKELMRICYVGLLLEAAGRRGEALGTFEGLEQKLEGSYGSTRDRVQSAIRRLSIEPTSPR